MIGLARLNLQRLNILVLIILENEIVYMKYFYLN